MTGGMRPIVRRIDRADATAPSGAGTLSGAIAGRGCLRLRIDALRGLRGELRSPAAACSRSGIKTVRSIDDNGAKTRRGRPGRGRPAGGGGGPAGTDRAPAGEAGRAGQGTGRVMGGDRQGGRAGGRPTVGRRCREGAKG
jgi:hypothetical protein